MMCAPIDGSSVRIELSAEGGAPQGVRADLPPSTTCLLRVWHMKVEAWVREQAAIVVAQELAALRVVAS
jgi:hypothetical protein